jgi:hypothetical protein
MASQPQPRYENHGREADFCGMKGKREENEERNFNVEKGERLFLPWISFLLPLPSFLMIFTEKKEPRFLKKRVLFLGLHLPRRLRG